MTQVKNQFEVPRGFLFSAPIALLLWALLLTGCTGQGSWDLHGEALGMKWQIAMTNTPPKPEDKPVIQTFDDFFQKWWESLWMTPADALTQPDHVDVTTLTTGP